MGFESSIETTNQPRVRAAVALVEDERVLLVRHRKGERTYWLLPGGGVEYGEPAREAARREVLEETGLEVRIGPLLLVSETVPPDRSRHLIHLVFEATRSGGELQVGEDPRVDEVCYVPIQELEGLIFHPPFAPQLRGALEGRFDGRDRFLGSLWVD